MSAAETSSSSSSLPPAVRVRLYELFVQIEREFELLYTENLGLQEKIERMRREHQMLQTPTTAGPFGGGGNANLLVGGGGNNGDDADGNSISSSGQGGGGGGATKFQTPASGGGGGGGSNPSTKGLYKLRSHTNKLRAQTNRLMSNLGKGGSPALTCTPVRRYTGHKDGIWEVSVSRMGLPILGTASADHTAMIWGMHSGQALLQYTGHSGSVNSLRFHPNKELVLTASGDGTVHIWQCAVHLYNESSSGRVASSEDELDSAPQQQQTLGSEMNVGFSSGMEDENQFSVLRTPLRSLNGHSGVAIAADWLPGGEQAVTAGEYDYDLILSLSSPESHVQPTWAKISLTVL